MFDGLFIASIIGSLYQCIKEVFEPTIPAEQRANEKLLNKDIIKGVPYEQIKKNIRNGKYRLSEPQIKVEYPEPHRNSATGKIIIENFRLHQEDMMKYNGYQVMEWAKQGKYNLSPEERDKELVRYKKEQGELSKKYVNKNTRIFR